MGLFTPAWNSENPAKRIAALEEQSQLLDIIEHSLDINVSLTALNRLTDKTMLEYLAKQKRYYRPYSDVRIRVAEKLEDTPLAQEIYADIAKNEKELQIRMKVAEKLVNTSLAQETYADIVKVYDTNMFNNMTDVRTIDRFTWEAWEKITDKAKLIDIAKNAKEFEWRLRAANEVTGLTLEPDYWKDTSLNGMAREKERISQIFLKEIEKIEKTCGKETPHDWNGCVCLRCGSRRDTNHDWKYKIGTGHINYSECEKCGKICGLTTSHIWETSIVTDTEKIQIPGSNHYLDFGIEQSFCKNCHFSKQQSKKSVHCPKCGNFGSYDWGTDGDTADFYFKCGQCGYTIDVDYNYQRYHIAF